LLELPNAALGWVHALLEILLKYRQVIGLGDLARDLVETSRQLRELRTLLRDPERSRFVPVTRAADLPRVETVRLIQSLDKLGVPVGPILVNAVTPEGCDRCSKRRTVEKRQIRELSSACRSRRRSPCVMLQAPAVVPQPRGVTELEHFGERWSFVPR
jgi:arsenite-transporting ATPase